MTLACRIFVLIAAALVTLGPARAVSLFWGETPVKTASFATCMAFAGDAMRLSNARNIRRSPNEVAGTIGGAYAAITCIATSPHATAMVMVAGDNATEAMGTRDLLRSKIAGMIRFD